MKFLLLGNGLTIKYIKKYIKHHKDQYIQAVFEYEKKDNLLMIDEKLLDINDIDYVIKSPGISETNQIYLKLKTKFKFINELDLLKLYNEKVKTIVITGSNGKTTFVSLLTYLLKKAKYKVISCGNSFYPITKYYKKFNKLDYLIIEQSSFQLHNLAMYNPLISIILNISENHLDNTYSFNSYIENKKNIYKFQNKENYYIYDNVLNFKNIDTNANIINLLHFNNNIDNRFKNYQVYLDYIYTIFKLLNIDINYINNIKGFKFLKYRITHINYKNTHYINDSKSTSVDSTLFALKTIDNNKNVVLIIGGKDKNLNYKRLDNKAKYIISYGKINYKTSKQISNVITCSCLKKAFIIAKHISVENKVILFSPAASSLDTFKSFKDRGKYFNYLIKKYGKKKI